MNTRLILEEAKERTKSQLKNNIKFWIKWGLSILFFLLSVISFMSVIVITSIKQTVSTEAIEESKDLEQKAKMNDESIKNIDIDTVEGLVDKIVERIVS